MAGKGFLRKSKGLAIDEEQKEGTKYYGFSTELVKEEGGEEDGRLCPTGSEDSWELYLFIIILCV